MSVYPPEVLGFVEPLAGLYAPQGKFYAEDVSLFGGSGEAILPTWPRR
jgi:hypothetical protein